MIWHGHACFELRGSKATVVLDPFRGLGIPEPKAEADVVLCSHSHGDHNNTGPVLKEVGVVLEGFIGETEVQGILVEGISSFHDNVEGSQRGKNSIYVLQLDELRFCHLGDLGHKLTDNHVKEIGDIDLLFTPIGGGPTIDPDEASIIVDMLKSRIVVPMHYNAEVPNQEEWIGSRLHKVDDFLSESVMKVEKMSGRSFKVTKETLPKEQKIIVLSLI